MSWDASFQVRADGRLVSYRDWNYTHNCNRMINTVLGQAAMATTRTPWWEKIAETPPEKITGAWWDLLDGKSGEEGAALLSAITHDLGVDHERFRAMNPSNGWGDFDSLYKILLEMRDVSRDFPTGQWSVSG